MGRKPESILDIGCGTGSYYSSFSKLGVTWEGLEISDDMVNFCLSQKIPVIRGQLDDLIKVYDVIFLSQVLEHILDPNQFMFQIYSHLSNDGIIQIDVPNHDSLPSLLRRLIFFHDRYGAIEFPHHLLGYTKRSLSKLLVSNGFDICKIQSYPNDHPVMGQLIVKKNTINKIYYKISGMLGLGSLLVAVAKKERTKRTVDRKQRVQNVSCSRPDQSC